MEGAGKLSKFFKIAGLLYLIVHGIFFITVGVLIFSDRHNAPANAEYILAVFPVLGVFAGYCVWKGRYNWWRILLVSLSFLFFIVVFFITIVIGLKLKDLKTIHQGATAYKTTMDSPTQRFFMGVYSSDMNTLEQYLDQGFDANAVNDTKQTALHITQSEKVLRLLIENGADVNALDGMHMTPIFNKEVYLSRILVDAGADFQAKSKKGSTPLMWYCSRGYLDGVKYMVSLGADVNMVNVNGQTAYDVAEHFGRFESFEYLKSIGAKSGEEIK